MGQRVLMGYCVLGQANGGATIAARLLPAADWLGRRRWGRALAVVLLALSVLSASYPSWNPWRHPWIYNWMDAWGRIPY